MTHEFTDFSLCIWLHCFWACSKKKAVLLKMFRKQAEGSIWRPDIHTKHMPSCLVILFLPDISRTFCNKTTFALTATDPPLRSGTEWKPSLSLWLGHLLWASSVSILLDRAESESMDYVISRTPNSQEPVWQVFSALRRIMVTGLDEGKGFPTKPVVLPGVTDTDERRSNRDEDTWWNQDQKHTLEGSVLCAVDHVW